MLRVKCKELSANKVLRNIKDKMNCYNIVN